MPRREAGLLAPEQRSRHAPRQSGGRERRTRFTRCRTSYSSPLKYAISNKYYEDDHSSTVREVDLVAYKVSHVQHFDVYTVLVVSCKKSDDKVWALLSRDINLNDPNANWWPLHTWTNDSALQYRLGEAECAKRYHSEVGSKTGAALSPPQVEVFAFQELSRTGGVPSNVKKIGTRKEGAAPSSSPRNDSAIFNSITSLMKAQAYELGALPNRKKTPAIYQFNLLTVADTDLLRMQFRGDEIECSSVPSEHYIGRYIINRRDTFSRIRFVQAGSFEGALADYARLHEVNCSWFDAECDAFFLDILKDWARKEALIGAFRKEVWIRIGHMVLRAGFKAADLTTVGVEHWDTDVIPSITVDGPDELVDFLKGSIEARERVAAILKKIYRYTGPFDFRQGIPF